MYLGFEKKRSLGYWSRFGKWLYWMEGARMLVCRSLEEV